MKKFFECKVLLLMESNVELDPEFLAELERNGLSSDILIPSGKRQKVLQVNRFLL